MNCPICDEIISRVIASKPDTVESQLRQRKCISCHHKWWTCEVELPLGAVKWVRPDNTDCVPRRLAGFRRVTFS